MKKEIVDLAYERAIKVLELTSTPYGFFAAYPGYDAVWARDSMISSLGASELGEKFKNTFKQSLITLSKNQSDSGQIPNAVDKYSKRKPHVDFQSIDSTMWFIIGWYHYKKKYGNSLFKIHKENIKKSLIWLKYQDISETGMLTQLPTSDWQDAFPHRYGYTINTQALYYKVLLLFGEKKLARKIKAAVNGDYDKKLWNGNFYLPWRWKNHNKYQEKGEWFDSLGNLLAILFDLADKYKSEKIFRFIKKNKIDEPYPIKSIYPPIKKGSKDWQDYFEDSDARTPYNYSNGGIWTYIGGFYVLALLKHRKFAEAEKQLKKLAEANMKLGGNFSEWLNGKTGKPSKSGNQAWNAGMYILAYNSLKK